MFLWLLKLRCKELHIKDGFSIGGKVWLRYFLSISLLVFVVKLDLLDVVISLKDREDLWFIVKTHLLCKIGAPLEGSLIVTFCSLEQPSLSDF